MSGGYFVRTGAASPPVFVINAVAKQQGAWPKSGTPRSNATAYAFSGTCTAASALIVIDWPVLGTTAVYVHRVTPDGTRTSVRGSPATPSDSHIVFWDNEVPLNTNVYYVVCAQGTILISNTINIVSTTGWLRDPLSPNLDLCVSLDTSPNQPCPTDNAVTLSAFDANAYASRSGIFPILNAARPAVTTMMRRDLTSALSLITRQAADATHVHDILMSGRVLLLQLPSIDYGWGSYGSDYIAADNVTASRPDRADMRMPGRTWSVPFAVANMPAGPTNLVGGNAVPPPNATWGSLAASGMSWLVVSTSYATWLDLAKDDSF
jgi:hypothetical protein